jgi:hypothetical protein
MNGKRAAIAVVAAALMMATGTALAQTKPECEGGKVKTPAKVDGQVVKIDASRNLVTVRGDDGTVHEFQASKETLQDLKAGDRIQATLREAPKCP